MTDETPPTASTDEHHDEPAETERGHEPDDERYDALREHAIPLDTTDPGAGFENLAALRERFADARFIGLGEATHGTREFFQIKHRILRYLVSELDCRLIALEANFPEALAIDEYVVHGEGDPAEALAGIYFWTWNVESVLSTLEWLREFNRDRPLDDRVRFHGIDAQYSQGAVDNLLRFFETVDEELPESLRSDLNRSGDGAVPPSQADSDDLEERLAATERVVPELRDRLRENRDPYVNRTTRSVWEIARQHVRVLEQAAELGRAWRDRLDADDEAAATERFLRTRDLAMADNVDWLAEHENADRVAIWAHDAHVNRAEQTSRTTDATAPSLGSHLAARHGEEYYALGFAFGGGSFQAIGPVPGEDASCRSLREWTVDAPREGTIDATLSNLGYPASVLDIRSAGADPRVAEWLSHSQEHFSIGAVYDPEDHAEFVTEYTYADAFDAVCYVAETTRALPIE